MMFFSPLDQRGGLALRLSQRPALLLAPSQATPVVAFKGGNRQCCNLHEALPEVRWRCGLDLLSDELKPINPAVFIVVRWPAPFGVLVITFLCDLGKKPQPLSSGIWVCRHVFSSQCAAEQPNAAEVVGAVHVITCEA